MFGLAKPSETPTAVVSTVNVTDRPELWVPPHLANHYPAAIEHVRKHVTAITARHWQENLSGGWLRLHVGDVIAATKYGGILPGSIRRPGVYSGFRPVRLSGSRESTMLTEHVVISPGENDELHAIWEAYQYSESHKESARAEVDTILMEVLATPARAWEAYQHLVAMDRATEQLRKDTEATKIERQRIATSQCPVCEDSDRETIGALKIRDLLDSDRYSPTAPYRSCLLCFRIASALYVDALAKQVCAEGKTRAELVTRTLSAITVNR